MDRVKKPIAAPSMPLATIPTKIKIEEIKIPRTDRNLSDNNMTIPKNKLPIINLEAIFLIVINILRLEFIDRYKSAS